jgi:hypothetical protein
LKKEKIKKRKVEEEEEEKNGINKEFHVDLICITFLLH